MASLQEAGMYYIDIRSPTNERKRVFSASSAAAGPGGSPDSVIANTPEKWIFANGSNVVGGSGYDIIFGILPSGTDTLDSSDSSWVIPIISNGNAEMLGNSAGNGLGSNNFTVVQAAGDVLLTAAQERDIAIYRAKEGVTFSFGNGKIFYTFEDDTA